MPSRLKENFEYIGIANLAADERTLRLVASEYSPLIAGEMKSKTTFTGIPDQLVQNMFNDLVYFFFIHILSSARWSFF